MITNPMKRILLASAAALVLSGCEGGTGGGNAFFQYYSGLGGVAGLTQVTF